MDEPRDQVTQDRLQRPWRILTDAERAAELARIEFELRSQANVERQAQETRTKALDGYAQAAAGMATLYAPAESQGDQQREADYRNRLEEIQSWAAETAVDPNVPPDKRRAAFELSEAGHALRHELERERDRGRSR